MAKTGDEREDETVMADEMRSARNVSSQDFLALMQASRVTHTSSMGAGRPAGPDLDQNNHGCRMRRRFY